MMLYEHELGREFIKKSSLALKNNKNKELIDNLRGYIELLREHIDKENNILYPMINSVLNCSDQQELLTAFERFEHKNMGKNVHEKYLFLVEEIGKEV